MATPDPATLPPWKLPHGITSRFIDTSPISLKFHVLEAIPSSPRDTPEPPPLILLLHGFPNLSYDWRYILPKLAAAGYYAVAPDLRGFGRTHDASLAPLDESSIRASSATLDMVALVHALGYTTIHTLVGQDLGAYMASIVTLMRPSLAKSLLLMAHTWRGIPPIPFATAPAPALQIQPPPSPWWETTADPDIHASLANLSPPRQHYKWYNTSPAASHDWTYPTGAPLVHFLAGYFHLKSGANTHQTPPRPLSSWTANQLALMPHYYIMLATKTVRQNVALDMAQQTPTLEPWLSPADLAIYEQEYARTTFALPLRWYNALTSSSDLAYLAGTKVSVPTAYVSGTNDWGTYQVPGGLEAMRDGVSVEAHCWHGATLVPGAGHWVNMEKPDESAAEILRLAAHVAGGR